MAKAAVDISIHNPWPASTFGPSKNIRYTEIIENALNANKPNSQLASTVATPAIPMSAETTNASDVRPDGHGRRANTHPQPSSIKASNATTTRDQRVPADGSRIVSVINPFNVVPAPISVWIAPDIPRFVKYSTCVV